MLGWEKRDRSPDLRIVARTESKCGERKGLRELEEEGLGRTMAIKMGAVKHARERTVLESWLWSKVEVRMILALEVGC